MWRFLGRRVLFMIVSVWGLATAVFLMIKVIPGDEAAVAAGESATAEMVEATRVRLGLDQPLAVQYVAFLSRLVRGDLGTSITSHQPVAESLEKVLPYTLELVGAAILFTVVVAVPAALVMAANHGKSADMIGRVATVIVAGMPIFWVGFVVQYLVAQSRVLPISGVISIQYTVPRQTGFILIDSLLAGDTAAFGDALAHLVLPAIVLAVTGTAVIIRTLRASLLGELHEDYVALARAKGASPSYILVRHALRNSSVATISTLGLQVGYLLAGSVIVESVFARPGIGSYLASAVTQKDTFAVLGSVIFIGTVVIIMSFLVDCAQLAIDPRVRASTIGAER
ncbi:ABC transporter permease [Microbacterium allomyrinae]|jgi:dipeptide transport system permease protein|uniref:ABC transporter permease n=1 Tax=Microbacterium allomyrinae TaxID=2830666 RepID=A0A9X1LWW4_9MICO|nr:ABC transporter permease [Microbacterium allomyrinae]MCC2033128.1 ABC transporter permease [Microbacterium allomyrinae]